jgi:hypothetical protein
MEEKLGAIVLFGVEGGSLGAVVFRRVWPRHELLALLAILANPRTILVQPERVRLCIIRRKGFSIVASALESRDSSQRREDVSVKVRRSTEGATRSQTFMFKHLHD